MRPTAAERLDWTFDDAQYTRIELPKAPLDPLRFRDQKRYADRLREAREKTGLEDAIIVAHGQIGGQRAVVAAMAFEFMGGSMGAAVGEGIVAAARLAVLQDAALVIFTASGGARMQEGAVSLMQMPRTTIATQIGEGSRAAVHQRADRSHHRRRDRLLCHAGRRADRRARRTDRLRRRPRDRADRARNPARRLPAGRIPARARHYRHGGEPCRYARAVLSRVIAMLRGVRLTQPEPIAAE